MYVTIPRDPPKLYNLLVYCKIMHTLLLCILIIDVLHGFIAKYGM